MTPISRKSGLPYYLMGLVLVVLAAGYWLYDTYYRHASLPVVMESPAFALEDLDGHTVTEERFAGKVRLVSFIFTKCPDICPATTANMVLLQNKLKEQASFGNDVAFASISFDPVNDTPEALRQYADRMSIDQSGWTLLRGTDEEVNKLASGYNISIVKLEDGLYAHSVTSLVLIDANNKVRNIYKMGVLMDNDIIMTEINALLQERQRKS
ncbi:SCO family protein [Paenibacillus sp. strain BS8-2]